MQLSVTVHALGVREQDKVVSAEDYLVLLLDPIDDAGDPLFAGTTDLLFDEMYGTW